MVTGGTSGKGVKKGVENIEYTFFVWGFVFEKIDFEFSLGTRALERKDYCSLSYFKTIEYVRKCS